MKKIVLFSIIVFCALYSPISIAQNTFDDYIIKTEKIDSPLLQNVFPGVSFSIETSQITMPPSKRIIAKYEKNDYLLPQDFNLIYNKVKNKSSAPDIQM